MSQYLKTLAKCEALKQEVGVACFQAAELLEELRELIITSASQDETIEQLKFVLAEQGEG